MLLSVALSFSWRVVLDLALAGGEDRPVVDLTGAEGASASRRGCWSGSAAWLTLMPSLTCISLMRVGYLLMNAAVAVPVASSNASEDQNASTWKAT